MDDLDDLPRPEAYAGCVMRPTLWLIADSAGKPDVPSTVTVATAVKRLASRCFAGPVWREYRHGSRRLLLLQTIARTVRGEHVAVAWAPVGRDGKGALDEILAAVGTVLARWPVDARDFTVAALEADKGTAAASVLAAWPAGWRQRTEKDDPGDPFAKPPRDPAPPSGPRCLALVAG